MKFNKKETKRKIFHSFSGVIIVTLFYFHVINAWILAIGLIVGLILSFITKKVQIPVISACLEHLDREEDIKKFPGKGSIVFIAGCLIAVLLFEKNIALASILIMSIGDAVSTIVGIHLGKIKNPINKSKMLEGTVVGIIVASIAASVFLNYKEAIFASLIGMIVESIDIKQNTILNIVLNDNITMPISSGLAVYLLRLL